MAAGIGKQFSHDAAESGDEFYALKLGLIAAHQMRKCARDKRVLKNYKMCRKKGINFKLARKACQSALAAGGRSLA